MLKIMPCLVFFGQEKRKEQQPGISIFLSGLPMPKDRNRKPIMICNSYGPHYQLFLFHLFLQLIPLLAGHDASKTAVFKTGIGTGFHARRNTVAGAITVIAQK